MPDPHAKAKAAYAEAIQDFDLPSDAHLTASEIANCTLCDDDGYRGLRVCDHIDRTETTARGMAAVRAAIERGGT